MKIAAWTFTAFLLCSSQSIWAASAVAWDLTTGVDSRSGRPYTIIKQRSIDGRAGLGMECQGGFETGIVGIFFLDEQQQSNPKRRRPFSFRVGNSEPVKILFELEPRSSGINYILNSKNERLILFQKLVDFLGVNEGKIIVDYGSGQNLVFADEQRRSVMDAWIRSCSKQKR